MQKVVLNNQCLLDIAIQEDGNVLAAFEWALGNGISITEELVPGQKLIVPSYVNRDNEIASYFNNKNQKIAASIRRVDLDIIIPQLGIGTMAIESTFIVAL